MLAICRYHYCGNLRNGLKVSCAQTRLATRGKVDGLNSTEYNSALPVESVYRPVVNHMLSALSTRQSIGNLFLESPAPKVQAC